MYLASAEDIVLAKLEWAKLGQSERQIEDVAGILRARLNDLDREYIDRWIGELSLNAEWSKAIEKAAVR